MTRVLVPLPVLLPLLGAGGALLLGIGAESHRARAQRALSIAVLAAVLAVAVALLVRVDSGGPVALQVGGWPAPLGITLVVDRLSALMLVVSSVVTLGVLVFAVGQGTVDGDRETPLSIFHPTYLILAAGVSLAFLSGDLFNLYVGFEVLLVASYVLITLGGTPARMRAGTTYVVVGILSSLVFLVGIAAVYAATGTLNLAQLADRLGALPDPTRTLLLVPLLVAFGVKAAVFPLSAWLPDSYPTAPAPVTAVFAGLLTKVGVYAILRTQTLLADGRALPDLLMLAALATMVVGILGAVAQTDIKRMLSFTLVSHIGYMVFGVALGSAAGLAGAVFYVAHHILVQTTLFLAAGLVERVAGSTSLTRVAGLATTAPVLAVLFGVPALNLAGVPPLSGFLGKVALLQAGIADGRPLAWVLVAGGVVTSLLTLVALAKVWGSAFWRPAPPVPAGGAAGPRAAGNGAAGRGAGRPAGGATAVEAPALAGTADVATPAVSAVAVGPPREPAEPDADGEETVDTSRPLPGVLVGATAVFVAVGLSLTVFAGPLFGLAERAAADLSDRGVYQRTVQEAGR